MNDHELGKQVVGVDNIGGVRVFVFTHTCLCKMFFIDDWRELDV